MGTEGVFFKLNQPAQETTTGKQPVSVWLVEDNHTFRRAVARVLSHVRGFECSNHFSNAEDALDALMGGGVPDVILLDVELPGQDGIEALHKMKALCPSARVVMLTVFDDHEKVFKAICAGASGYLLKASPVERIVEAINEALAGGAPMTPRVAKSVLDMLSAMSKPKHDYNLTIREKKILEFISQGLPKKDVAELLGVSFYTVDAHLRNIYTKLHVNCTAGAAAKAVRENLI